MRALICDDNEDMCKILSVLIEKSYPSSKTQIAYTGMKCLEIAKDFYPDIIILDIRLPDLLGYKVCEELRMCERTRDSGIIMLTGYAQDDSVRKKAMESEADAFLVKPVERYQVISQINLVLKAKKLVVKTPSYSKNNLQQLRNLTHQAFNDKKEMI